MNAYIQAIGLQAPGLEGWCQSHSVLTGERPYQAIPLTHYSPQFLPPNERRRTTDTIKLALRTAEDTTRDLDDTTRSTLPAIFACVDGDTAISAQMTQAILSDEPMVSPIHFHNSVHNAPAGYWMIGQRNHQAASAVSAGDHQLGNALLETCSQLDNLTSDVMLILYDLPIDPIIETYQPDRVPFGAGLILSQTPAPGALAQIEIDLEPSPPPVESNKNWFGANPAAQILPLLQAIAKGQPGRFAYSLSAECTLSVRLTLITERSHD
jgi:hypothetical protein